MRLEVAVQSTVVQAVSSIREVFFFHDWVNARFSLRERNTKGVKARSLGTDLTLLGYRNNVLQNNLMSRPNTL